MEFIALDDNIILATIHFHHGAISDIDCVAKYSINR